MSDLLPYKTMPLWTAETIPAGFLRNHNTKDGTWAQLTVLAGSLQFALTTDEGETLEEFTFTPEKQPPRIEPRQWHRIVSASADAQCQLQFLCKAEDYGSKKYELTRTHSEVLDAWALLQALQQSRTAPARALDLGSGRGRNSLFLALHGWEVDALEQSESALQSLGEIAQQEGLQQRLRVHAVDLNEAPQRVLIPGAPGQGYDLMVCTVVLMFLQPQTISPLLAQMQAATAPGGYNLIVCAMDTEDYPCDAGFPFTFKPGELKACYAGWEIVKYNEDPGHLHRRDAQGNPIALRFATLLARKPL